MTKLERVHSANEFIELIASRGQQFFRCTHNEGTLDQFDMVAQFKISESGRIFFLNEWKLKWIYVSASRGRWKGFHHGGTLRALVEALVTWIKYGELVIHPSNLDAKHWAYPVDAMAEIVADGQRRGIIKPWEVETETPDSTLSNLLEPNYLLWRLRIRDALNRMWTHFVPVNDMGMIVPTPALTTHHPEWYKLGFLSLVRSLQDRNPTGFSCRLVGYGETIPLDQDDGNGSEQ